MSSCSSTLSSSSSSATTTGTTTINATATTTTENNHHHYRNNNNNITASSTTSTRSSPMHISLGFTPGGSDALFDIFPPSASGSLTTTTAFPSWPTTASLHTPPEERRGYSNRSSACSSYISDEDLFGLDDDDNGHYTCYNADSYHRLPYLSEAPAPPRDAASWLHPLGQQQQPLQPLLQQHDVQSVRPLPQLARPKVYFKKSPKKMTAAASRRASHLKALPTLREASM